MLTRSTYKSTFYPSVCQGGVSNCLIISKLKFEDIYISACGPFWRTAGGICLYVTALP